MIKLNDHRTSILNLPTAIQTLDQLDALIEHYSNGSMRTACLKFKFVGAEPEVQIDRNLMITALQAQRRQLVDYLATLGIDAN